MDPTGYRFSRTFTLEAPRSSVHEVLVDLEHYSAWWPQVRAVGKLDDDHALVVCRSSLPYDLELELAAVSRDPERLEVGIEGPIRGWARFHLVARGAQATELRFEQHVRAQGRWFVVASYVVKPLLAWNHHRMMAGLVRGLQQRLGPKDQPRAATAAS